MDDSLPSLAPAQRADPIWGEVLAYLAMARDERNASGLKRPCPAKTDFRVTCSTGMMDHRTSDDSELTTRLATVGEHLVQGALMPFPSFPQSIALDGVAEQPGERDSLRLTKLIRDVANPKSLDSHKAN